MDGKPVSDEDLLQAYGRDGDEAAFTRLYNRYCVTLHAYLYKCVRTEPAAEALMLETWRGIAALRGRYRTGMSFVDLLMRVAGTGLRTYYRTKKPEFEGVDDAPADDGLTPRAALLALRRAVDVLADEQAEAVMLHLFNEMSAREIAEVQQVDATTAHDHLRDGMARLHGVSAAGFDPESEAALKQAELLRDKLRVSAPEPAAAINERILAASLVAGRPQQAQRGGTRFVIVAALLAAVVVFSLLAFKKKDSVVPEPTAVAIVPEVVAPVQSEPDVQPAEEQSVETAAPEPVTPPPEELAQAAPTPVAEPVVRREAPRQEPAAQPVAAVDVEVSPSPLKPEKVAGSENASGDPSRICTMTVDLELSTRAAHFDWAKLPQKAGVTFLQPMGSGNKAVARKIGERQYRVRPQAPCGAGPFAVRVDLIRMGLSGSTYLGPIGDGAATLKIELEKR